ncbi:hypothetical protein LTS18_004420 [Coniosporium uncinatum]|uniref:Uncharacterized protein n=1 Tax=Coniosporium uncinatum TaxID=93489 RepID=A0ACC3DS87_9PEZI|nr:hypothetical protein LTS18_004420 [Coniosporium uncinatum]
MSSTTDDNNNNNNKNNEPPQPSNNEVSAGATAKPHSSKLIFAPGGTDSSPQAQQYTRGRLDLTSLSPSPFTQFHTWFAAAQSSNVHQPETVCLSTAHLPSGKVSARYVYLKELDERGWVVYSNWATSRKSEDVRSNAHAALAFWWHEMERQVRVEGTCERMTREESQVYYDTRVRGSRLGAWASRQSEVLESRGVLERRVEEVERRFEGDERIPVPEFWGGLRVVPEVVEFWQGRESRLHDRFRYRRVGRGEGKGEGEWKIERLSP